jgi:hypothetical protein
MPVEPNRRRRRHAALVAAAICASSVAASASAADLHVRVKPMLKTGELYGIKTSGSYAKGELRGTAFLDIFIQFTTLPCMATATLESQLSHVNFYFTDKVPKSPFSRTTRFIAKGAGPRRVCAYLYPKIVRVTKATAPIATATATYHTTK